MDRTTFAAVGLGLALAACGGGGSTYEFEPIAYELAGLPATAALGTMELDHASAPVGMFDIGTFQYSYATKQWTKINDAAYGQFFTDAGLRRLVHGDFVIWRATPAGPELKLRRKGDTSFTDLPPLAAQCAVYTAEMTTDAEQSFYIGPVTNPAGGLAVAKLPLGATSWELLPLPSEAVNSGDFTGALAFDRSGNTLLYAVHRGGTVYVAALARGATAFTSVLTAATAQFTAAGFIGRPNADVLVDQSSHFLELHPDGTVSALPGEDSFLPPWNTVGEAQFDDDGDAYTLVHEGYSDSNWDVIKWDGSEWGIVHTTSNDAKLRVAPNGDLYFGFGLGGIGSGRMRKL